MAATSADAKGLIRGYATALFQIAADARHERSAIVVGHLQSRIRLEAHRLLIPLSLLRAAARRARAERTTPCT